MTAQLSSGARVDPLAVIRAHAESHRSLAASDAYSAQEAPKLEATLAAVAELVAADREYDEARHDFDTLGPGYARQEAEVALDAAAERRAAALAPFSEAQS